jgi:hypothetical protein
MYPGETPARRFHEVYATHFKVFYPQSQQFPTWEQLSERERALLVATMHDLVTEEAITLLAIINDGDLEGYCPSLEKIIEQRLKAIGFLLCSNYDGYYLSTPDPDLWKEPQKDA